MFKYKGIQKGVPQPTDLYFNYNGKGWTLVGTFKSKYAAKLYAYEHGHMISTYDTSWKIESTSYTKAKNRIEQKRIDQLNHWIAQQWYNFYTEKYGEDYLK